MPVLTLVMDMVRCLPECMRMDIGVCEILQKVEL